MEKKCISCESVGKDSVATHHVDLFGDEIPLCKDCYTDYLDGNLSKISLYDEEY